AAAGDERPGDVVVELREPRQPGREEGEVVLAGGAREQERVLARQPPGPRLGLVLDDPRGQLARQPLADVPLLEPRPLGDLLARRRLELRQGVVEPRPVPEPDRERQQGAVDRADQAAGERFNAPRVDLRHCHVASLVDVAESVPPRRPARMRGGTQIVPRDYVTFSRARARRPTPSPARAVRPETPIFAYRFSTGRSTVRTLSTSSAAIASFGRPCASRPSTSRSRAVSSDRSRGSAGAGAPSAASASRAVAWAAAASSSRPRVRNARASSSCAWAAS